MNNREQIGNVAETMLGYFENNKTFQTDTIATVPAASYTDPKEANAANELIFKRLPLMLALSCEMPKPGDYKAMEVVGLPILIARDRAGSVRAFLNVCAHRWAPVAAEGHGHCQQFRFVCQFHGWSFGADGKLLAISDGAKFGAIDKAAHGLRELPCKERYGMIFVCLTPGTVLDLDGYYGALLEDFADLGLHDWHFLGSSVLEIPNWKLIWTNFFENYHVATQHRNTLAPYMVSNTNHYEAFGPHMRIGWPTRSIAKLRDVPREQWGQREGEGLEFIFMRFLFPNVTTNVNGNDGSTAIGQIFPGSTPDKCRFVSHFLRKGPQREEGELEKMEKEANAILRDEDSLSGEQLNWLLDGYNVWRMRPHDELKYLFTS
jgi:phenylpropionate dioxygenase-like ring-hydroxylating dioxygenase large terminal subunit